VTTKECGGNATRDTRLAGKQRWVRDERVLSREASGRLMLLPPGRQEPLLVTEPGGVLWELLAEPAELGTLAATIAELYGERADRVSDDLAPVFDELISCGAVRPAV
jgi:hypothetical protein